MDRAPREVYREDPAANTFGFRRCCAAIREAVPVEEVARRYTELKPYGSRARFKARCPLPDHEDPTPSFYIYPDRRYWCFGCGRGGDVIDLEFFCGDYGELWEAMISLAVEYDVDLPKRPRRGTVSTNASDPSGTVSRRRGFMQPEGACTNGAVSPWSSLRKTKRTERTTPNLTGRLPPSSPSTSSLA
jgi:hypothetical protein